MCQEVKIRPVNLSDSYSLHGKINDNLEIYMEINVDSEFDYDKGCIIGNYYKIFGTYSYVKFNKPIVLVGTTKNINDSIVLFELDSNFDKVASFKGILTQTEFSGIWTSLKKSQSYSYAFKRDLNKYGYCSLWKSGCNIILDQISNPNSQGSNELISYNVKANKTFVLIESTEPCCGAYNCRGSGCGGENIYLNIFEIKDCFIINNIRQIISSTCNWIEVNDRKEDDNSLNLNVSIGENGSPVDYTIIVDKKNLDKGIIKEKGKK